MGDFNFVELPNLFMLDKFVNLFFSGNPVSKYLRDIGPENRKGEILKLLNTKNQNLDVNIHIILKLR